MTENAWCRFIVNNPKKAFGLTGSLNLCFLLLTGLLMLAKYDLFPAVFDDVPLELTKNKYYLRSEAWLNRNDADNLLNRDLSESLGTREAKYEAVYLYYDLQDKSNEHNNVFTKRNLMEINSTEESIRDVYQFKEFCKLTGPKCDKFVSVVRLFDGTFRFLNSIFYDPNFDNIPIVLSTAKLYPMTKGFLDIFLGKNARISSTTAFSDITRSLFYLGYPLSGYKSIKDKSKEQKSKITSFVVNNLRPKLGSIAKKKVGDCQFIFESLTMYKEDLQKQVLYDLLLAAGSFIFIFIFMAIQTQSLFVTFFGILSIITSFAGSNLIYRIIFDYKYFGIFHVLSVFIILGIGADDIFVFYDTWRACQYNRYENLTERLTDCYKRSVFSMLITSSTTMVAFLVNAFSPLLAVQSFGLFSGILVLVNYFTVITFFPCAVIIHHLYWQSKVNVFKWMFNKLFAKSTSKVENEMHGRNSNNTNNNNNNGRDVVVVDENDRNTNSNNSINNPKGNSIIIRFFSNYFYRFITHKILRWIILIFYVALLSFFIYYATLLKPDEEAVKIFKDDTNYGKAKSNRINAFQPSENDQVIKVYMIWGIKEQDRSNCHKTDFINCNGQTVSDPAFDMNPAPAQITLLKFCKRLNSINEKENKKLFIRRNSLTGQLEIQCFIDKMNDFYLNLKKPATVRLKIPITELKMQRFMNSQPQIYNMSNLSETFYRYFETSMEYWLQNAYTELNYDHEIFADLLGHSKDGDNSVHVQNKDKYFGTKLNYAAIVVNTTLKYGTLGYKTGLPITENWEEFFTNSLKDMPPSLSGGFQATPDENNMWHWFLVQKELSNSAFQGIIIGISLAFPILTLATNNYILGFISTLIIGCITVTVIGLIPLSGWKLGVLESLNLTLVVGLAVDYVVHLAEAYHTSPKNDRKGKVKDMLGNVGISIISGACTTLGASLFMLFAKILFFMQFGIFMFGTIAFSMLYSLGLFSTFLALIGPENQTGSIKPVINILKKFINSRNKTHTDCDKCNGKGYVLGNKINQTDSNNSQANFHVNT